MRYTHHALIIRYTHYTLQVYRRSGYDAAFDADEDKFEEAIAYGGAKNNAGPVYPFYDGGGSEYEIGAPRSKIMRRDHGKVDY
jgi:hypothetical protein